MTTKPKARKFRIRRAAQPSAAAAAGVPAGAAAAGAPGEAPGDVSGATPGAIAGPNRNTAAPHGADQMIPDPDAPQANPFQGQVSSAGEMDVAGQIDAIRQEGLTGRQLRMARRLAQKHGLAPTSDFDAVRLLRNQGVDPFSRGTILELVSNDRGKVENAGSPATAAGAGGQPPVGTNVQLPQTMPMGAGNLPSTELSPAERRSVEIERIQKDIAKRRRRKLALLFSRLGAFVFLPTLLAGYYYYAVATPMYSTKSTFLILTADGGAGAGGMGGLLSGTPFATAADAIATQGYLESKDAMLRLDADVGFRAVFDQDNIDAIQALPKNASAEKAHKLYKKYVKLGYDPTEGVMRMEVSAPDPAMAKVFSEKLIEYAEERVDQLSVEKRIDALEIAQISLDDAKQQRREAQIRMVRLQEQSGVNLEGTIAGIQSLVNNVELQLQEKQLALAIQQANPRPNASKVAALESEISVLTQELAKQSARLTNATGGQSSLAASSAEIQMAQADVATADLVLQTALETMRQSQIEASKQVRYLTVSVSPVASEDPSYPRSFENTVLAFLVFSGIYLMISLTASVLREQVSS